MDEGIVSIERKSLNGQSPVHSGENLWAERGKGQWFFSFRKSGDVPFDDCLCSRKGCLFPFNRIGLFLYDFEFFLQIANCGKKFFNNCFFVTIFNLCEARKETVC